MAKQMSAEELLEMALGALQPFYDEGDDGSPVRLSLEAIAGLLAEHAGTNEESDLVDALNELDAEASLMESVSRLYDAAKGGEYGAGLSEEQAAKVNDEVQEVFDQLHTLVLGYMRPKPQRQRKSRSSIKGKPR